MHIVIGVIAAVLIRIGLQWIFGKGWGWFLTLLWMGVFFFFALSKAAPPFPIGLFKGASYTTGTFAALGVILAPLIIGKVAIQESTQDKAKAWVGGFLFCFMSLSVIVVWGIMSALDSSSGKGINRDVEETIVDTPPPPLPPSVGKQKRMRAKSNSSKADAPQLSGQKDTAKN
jgi:hypothetical protein